MRLLLFVCLTSFWFVASAHAESQSACSVSGAGDVLQAVSPEGDLAFATAGPARLAGVRLPEAPWREAALALLREQMWREGRVAGPEARDRWGRRAVRLLVAGPGGSDPRDVARMLVEAGLAVVDPLEGEPACARVLLALEAAARQRGLGVWAGDRYTPIPAAEAHRLKDRLGRFTLVEGRIRSIGERPQRTYLNFSSEWASDFTIIVPKRVWTRMAERGLDAGRLKGRVVRARGILEDRQGPALTVQGPEVIEVVDEGRGL